MDIYTLLLAVGACIAGFVLGIFVTFSGAIYYIIRVYQKKSLDQISPADPKKIADAKALIEKLTVVKDQLTKVKAITETQLALQSQIELPQKNSLDGRHKNRLISQIKSLEEDKVVILQGILSSGFDPEVAYMNEENKRETIKLSEYMARQGIFAAGTTPETKKVDSKFSILKGGLSPEESDKLIESSEDDGSDNTTH